MHLSHYVKAYPFEERPGHLLLYSTKRASLALVKEETYRSLRNGAASPSDETLLSKLGMLVHDRDEEKRATLDHFEEINARDPILHVLVMLNLDCNFACPYCYVGDTKGQLYMSDETEDRLVDFIKQRFSDSKQQLLVDFHGGEPLLSTGRIASLSRTLKSLTESRGGTFNFTLVSNGSLLRRPLAEELAHLGLQTVKITLDGPAENHDRSRPFKSGAGSFHTIMRNTLEVCDLVKIGIGGNFTRDNYPVFVSLLDEMEEAGLTPDKVSVVKFDPVMENPENGASSSGCRIGCLSVNEPWLWEAEQLLREEILKRGYHTPKPAPTHCMIERADSYVVNFDGTLYKCPTFVGKTGFEVGDIGSGLANDISSYKPDIWKNEECAECEYLPLCFGGCRYMTLVRDRSIDEVDCKRAYLDASLETLIKQDLKYRPKAARTKDGKKIDLDQLTRKLELLTAKHFPKQFRAFRPPSLQRIITSYHNIDMVIQKYVFGKKPERREPRYSQTFDENAFLAVAAIRYIDDFIDHALWPAIPEFNPGDLSLRFEIFLKEALDTAREFDPDMPDTIIALPKLEMHLALHPDQETFDQNFTNLFTLKSLDMFYVYQKIHGDPPATLDLDQLKRLALIDYIRDFSSNSIAADTDLNLYKHVRDNGLDPQLLIQYLKYHYETADTRVPFHGSFSMLYSGAMHLLQELT